MFISHRLPTAYGFTLASEPRGLTIPSNPADALVFAAYIDQQAESCLAEGRFAAAECLSHAAYEARCRAGAR